MECKKLHPDHPGPLCGCAEEACSLGVTTGTVDTEDYTDEERAEAAANVVEAMRQFETGATRNLDTDPDIYGFTSPLALGAFAEYMHANRTQADGTLRDSDNWKKGIPLDSYIRSMRRHMQDLTLIHDGYPEMAREGLFEALGGLFFNVQGYMHETIKAEHERRQKEELLHEWLNDRLLKLMEVDGLA